MIKNLLRPFYKTIKNKCSKVVALLCIIFSFYSLQVTAESSNILESYISVNSITQDNQGYIWFAGHHGLSRFDGSRMITFSSQDNHRNVPFTWVHNIRKVGDDFIVSTESHQLWKFTPATGTSEKITLNLPSSSIYNTIIFNNKFYVYAKSKVFEYTPSSGSAAKLINDYNTSYLERTQRHLYAAGKDGVFKLTNNKFSLIIKEPTTSITSIKDGLIVLNNKQINFIHDNGTITSIPNTAQYVASTKSNDETVILLNKLGEIAKISVPTLTYVKHNYPKLEPMYPTKILQDKSNVLWVLSSKGIRKSSPSFIKNTPKLYNVKTNSNEVALLQNEVIVGTYGDGIHSFNNSLPELSKTINAKLNSEAKRTMDLLAINNSLYIASFDGLWVYNILDKSTKKVDFPDNDKILLKLILHEHLLYIGTNENGFYIYNTNTKKIVEHVDVSDGLTNSEIIGIQTVDNKNIWLATPSGIDIYNLYTKKVKHIDTPGKSKVITFATANNKVYAATKGDGIFVLNFHGEILSRIANGIDFTHITTINNEVWAPARHGLYRINPINNAITLVPNTEKYTFTDAPVKLNDKIFVPHYGGMLEAQLKISQQFNPAIVISETVVSGKTSLTNKVIKVASENDVVSLTLASLDYRSGKNKLFQYKINNSEWNNIVGSQLTLTGLRSGTYDITIRGTNSLGQWSNKQAFTEINVKYDWYATKEMKILYFVVLSLIVLKIFWLLYLRSKSISHVHNLLENEITTKGKSAFNVTRNLMQVKELLLKSNKENLNDYHTTLLEIVESSIEELNQSDEDEQPKTLYGQSLSVALPYFADYVHNKYHVNLDVDYNLQELELNYELQADIYRMVYEAITSAIINSNSSNFDLSIQEFKQKLWITISNNEKSFSNYNNKVNFDMSMYLIRQIAIKHSASINVFDKEVTGSQIVISIPLMSLS